MGSELVKRRAERRYERVLPIEFSCDGQNWSARTRNLSLGGVFIETDVKLPYTARLRLRLRIPTLPEPIETGGQVRWCESSDELQGLGVRFDSLRAREVWALNRFFNALR